MSSCKGCPSATPDGKCSSGQDVSSCSSQAEGPSKQEQQDQQITDTLSNIKYKIFVMSGKGGVGKSSVTVNVASALAAMGYKVGIMDVDLHGPSVPNLMGLSGTLDIDEDGLVRPKQYNENLWVISMDTLMEDTSKAVLWRGPMKTSAIRQFISDIHWGELDFLFIDSPPGTGDEPMTVMKTVPEALSLVVTTPQNVSLNDVRKSISFLQTANASVLGLVENMSGLACPHCGGEIDLFTKGGGEKLAKEYGLNFLGAIPLDPATVVAGDMGTPVVLLEQDSHAKTAFTELAGSVVNMLKEREENLSK